MMEGFHGFVMFSLCFHDWLNSAQQRLGSFTKDAGQKMFKPWQTYEGLKISVNSIIEATNFLFDIRLSMY